jgi:SAM-dependent methyltransferase
MFMAARGALLSPSQVIRKIDKDWRIRSTEGAFRKLRAALSLEDFTRLLFSLPDDAYPKLSRLLPSMASEAAQIEWTGQTGEQLLRASVAFIGAVTAKYAALAARPLDQVAILDYGCGYGRLARLMYYFTAPQNVYGIDPRDESIEHCHNHGLVENFRQSEYLPATLPLERKDFGLIYAFSVFTHLSKRATLIALAACRQHIAADGILVITIRPLEYWDVAPDATPEQRPVLKQAHAETGFAFIPHIRAKVDGEVTYGDTGISLDWLAAHAPEWKVCGTTTSNDDVYQIIVFLRPV